MHNIVGGDSDDRCLNESAPRRETVNETMSYSKTGSEDVVSKVIY